MKILRNALAVIMLLMPMMQPAGANGTSVTVFAAASLREAFEAAAPAFTKKTGLSVTFDFGGSDTLATQILQGAPADVFASANTVEMQRAADGGRLGNAPVTFARNRIVVIVPEANPAHITSVADLAKPGVRVVLAAPAVPVGAYARKALGNLHIADAVEKNVVSNEADVKAVATKIALDEGDAGIVYSTDITPEIAGRVRKIELPPGTIKDAVYPIAAIKDGPAATGAAAFIDFMLHDGQAYMRARGFIAP
jgi:molybdate transport system substrate-binding protein